MRRLFGVDQLRVGDRRQQLAARDVLTRVDVDLVDVSADERRQRLRARPLHDAGFRELRLIAGVRDLHDARGDRVAARPCREGSEADDGDEHDDEDDDVATTVHGAPGSTTASGPAMPTDARRRTSALR